MRYARNKEFLYICTHTCTNGKKKYHGHSIKLGVGGENYWISQTEPVYPKMLQISIRIYMGGLPQN